MRHVSISSASSFLKQSMKKKIISALRKHLKTKEYRRPDLDYYVGDKKKRMFSYINSWGASQEAGFKEAMRVIQSLQLPEEETIANDAFVAGRSKISWNRYQKECLKNICK